MVQTTENILKKLYCDKYDSKMVSYLSLFLYDDIRILLGKDINRKVVAVHTWNLLASAEKPISQVWKDELYKLDVPTNVFVHNQYFSLVPGVVFNPDFLDTYLAFSSDLPVDLKTYYTGLDSNNVQLVGGMDTKLFQLLSDGKSYVSFHHGASSFLSYCLNEKSKLLPQEILVYLFDKSFYIAAFDKQSLVLFNKFNVQSKEDLLKYLFGITNQLGFDRKHCRFTLFGKHGLFEIKSNWALDYFKNFKIEQIHFNQSYHPGTESFANTNHFESHWEIN